MFPKITFEIDGLNVSCVVLGTGEVVEEVREGGCDEDEEDDVMMSEELVAAGRAESDNPSGATIDVEACTTVVGVVFSIKETDCTDVLVIGRD